MRFIDRAYKLPRVIFHRVFRNTLQLKEPVALFYACEFFFVSDSVEQLSWLPLAVVDLYFQNRKLPCSDYKLLPVCEPDIVVLFTLGITKKNC